MRGRTRPFEDLKVFYTPILLALLVGVTPALARNGSSPPSSLLDVPPLSSVETLHLEPIDPAVLLARDEAKTFESPGPVEFAEAVILNVSPATDGTWHKLPDGGRLWRLRISAPGATDLNFGFTTYWLPKGATLHLVSEAVGYVEGPYDSRDNADHRELWTPVIPGSGAVIEVYVPVGVSAEPELVLGQVGRGYRDFFALFEEATKDHGSCNIDVVCPKGNPWRKEIRSVAVYAVNGIRQCTGTLIMDVPRTFKPYFLTAAHCNVTSSNDQTVVVYWKYEAPSCGLQGGGPLSFNQTGAIWRAGDEVNDMNLLELEEAPSQSFEVYYAGWDARSATRPRGSVGIHHPRTHVKSISFNTDPLTIGRNCQRSGPEDTHWYVDEWEDGTTERGSSGSGLWDSSSHLLVGYLTGGAASCDKPSEYDCYGRMAIAWDGSSDTGRLRDWLDPNSTGIRTVTGSNPGGGGGGGGGGGAYVYWVPAMVHAPGQQGSQWRSDLGALNVGNGPSDIQFTLYTSSGVHTNSPLPSFPPGNHRILSDLVGQMGLHKSGHLKLETDQPFIFTARIFNQAPSGTFGQYMDGFTAADGLSSGQEAVLPHLLQYPDFRANIGAANMGNSLAAVRFTLYRENGSQVGSFTLNIPPGQWRQDGEPFSQRFNVNNLFGGYAVARVTAGSGVTVYASVVDNNTNDATTFPMQRTAGGGAGSYTYWVPAAVHGSGAQGSQWRSDLGVVNVGNGPSDIQFTLYTSNGPYQTSSNPIPRGESGVFPDLVGQMGLNATGNLKLETDQPFIFTARIYNQTPNGTFGQYMDGYTAADGLSSGQEAVLPQLVQNGDFRANIGAANMGSSTATVRFTLYRGNGSQVGSFTLTIPPGQWRQDGEPFKRRFSINNLNEGYAVARVTSGSGVIVYASVVDNDTNDATTFPMKR